MHVHVARPTVPATAPATAPALDWRLYGRRLSGSVVVWLALVASVLVRQADYLVWHIVYGNFLYGIFFA